MRDVGLAEPWPDVGLTMLRQVALSGKVAKPATIVVLLVVIVVLVRGGTLDTTSCIALGAIVRLGRPAWLATSIWRLLLFLLLPADMAVAMLSGAVERATNGERLVSHPLLIINSLNRLVSSLIVNVKRSIIV
jgi:hypothetical protein